MSDLLLQQEITKQNLSIFIRDLSENVSLNLKHIIEDLANTEKKNKSVKHKHNKNKKQVIKKKDLIIQQQNEKRKQILIDEDFHKIPYFFQNMNIENPLYYLNKLKTDEGRIEFKFQLLHELWKDKKKYMKYIIVLYYNLYNIENISEGNKLLLTTIGDRINEYEIKLYMMKNMGDLLSPLNYWDSQETKLDQWQIDVIHHIKNNESVIVKAPTSSGKSWVSMAAGILHKKIIFVCPAKPVAYQIGSHFIHMGYKVHFLVDNISHYSFDTKTNIFVGTPLDIENNIDKIGIKFDYAVFDEIHNLNKEDDGDIYENLIKLIDCNFLALSATINNYTYLCDIFKKIRPDKKINYIEYNKRFINHQKWKWENNKMYKLHPLGSFSGVNEINIENSLSFTPNDCAVLWQFLEEIFNENDLEEIIEDYSPDEYFNENKLLSLDDCSKYETFLKEKLIELNKKYPEKIQRVFTHFNKNNQYSNNENNDIISFIKKCKQEDLLPMIMFHTDKMVCSNLFHNIYEYLDRREFEEFPYHYDILEYKEKLYQEYINKRSSYENKIIISKSSTDSLTEKKTKLETYDRKEKEIFCNKIIDYYDIKIKDVERNDGISDTLKKLQINNLGKEKKHFMKYPDFNSQDIFQKHKDFIFTKHPMSGEVIRNVRRDIMKTLNLKIPYENPIFQMLKRGIGLYTEDMPDEYNWILQKLLNKREIGIIISDKTLCLGIDLPIRTSCFLGINDVQFSKEEYLQMAGRAGRRGKDTQGNIIFYDKIDYLNLMKGELPNIIGNYKPIYDNYKVSKHCNDLVFNNMIHSKREYIQNKSFEQPDENKQLVWYLRNYEKSLQYSNTIFNLECELFRKSDNDQELLLLQSIFELSGYNDEDILINLYKLKNITYNYIDIFKNINKKIMYIHNSLNKDKYLLLRNTCKRSFKNINNMLFNRTLFT